MRTATLCAIAIYAFAGIGARAATVQPIADRLVGACAVYDQKAMDAACRDFVDLGEAALPAVIALLDHPDANVRWQSVIVLGDLEMPADDLEVELAAACADRDADVRASAVGVLVTLYPQWSRSLSLATELCRDPHDLVRANALMARWRLAREFEVPTRLAELLSSKDWMVSRAAVEHLVEIGAPAVAAVLGFAADTESDGCAVAIEVLGAVGDLGEHETSVVAILERYATGIEGSRAAAATLALANIAPEVLARLSSHAAPEVRARSVAALGDDPCFSPVYESALADSATAVRLAAIAGIGRIGSSRSDLGRSLIRFLEDPDPDIRGAALASLGKLGGEPLIAARPQIAKIGSSDPKDYLRRAAEQMTENR